MPQALSLVTLLTDFGTTDYFVASMKGVILGINPQARIVDLSHNVPAHSIDAAAYLLKASYSYFPDGTVHIAVVDPGVGTTRRPLLVTTSRYHFIAPDNGLLSYIYANELGVEVRAIENKQYRLDSEGATFDGRDVFAPAAAWLTKGQQPGSYGHLIKDYARLTIPEPIVEAKALTGHIIYVDHFGNLITNVTELHLRELRGATRTSEFALRIAGHPIDQMTSSYENGLTQAPAALMNSQGHLEVFVKEGSAANLLKCGIGEKIELQ